MQNVPWFTCNRRKATKSRRSRLRRGSWASYGARLAQVPAPVKRPRRIRGDEVVMANINELMDGWSYGKQTDIVTANTAAIWRHTNLNTKPWARSR